METVSCIPPTMKLLIFLFIQFEYTNHLASATFFLMHLHSKHHLKLFFFPWVRFPWFAARRRNYVISMYVPICRCFVYMPREVWYLSASLLLVMIYMVHVTIMYVDSAASELRTISPNVSRSRLSCEVSMSRISQLKGAKTAERWREASSKRSEPYSFFLLFVFALPFLLYIFH